MRFLFNRQPLSIEAGADDEVIGVTVVETRLGEPDANGRQNAVPIEGSESLLEADVVIIAFGFSPSVPAWLAELGWKASPMAASSPVARTACRSRPRIHACSPVVTRCVVPISW